jgi:hypothetical protein
MAVKRLVLPVSVSRDWIDHLAAELKQPLLQWGLHGPTGWWGQYGHRRPETSVIVTTAPHEGAIEWVHASIAHPAQVPSYRELSALHRCVFGDGWAYQVFVQGEKHVDIHPYALHLWGRLDGRNVLPDFGAFGTI